MSERYTLHLGDCIEVMRTMADNSVDSIVTDPPYHLTQVSRGPHAASANPGTPHARARIGDKGFMGKTWDGGDIAHRVEMWTECLRVLKPGGYLLAFSGSRTYHRMTCAIEDAGFEIRDQVMWIYGSGFPKSLDVSKAIDKAAAATRKVIGQNPNFRDAANNAEHHARWNGAVMSPNVTAPATDAALQWEGWGTALKPAHEPICVARKPFCGTAVNNVLKHGTGALNIEGCRVPVLDAEYARNCSGDRGHAGTRGVDREGATNLHSGGGSAASGRWPANVIHDGSPEVLDQFPDAPGQMADARTDGATQDNAVFGALAYVRKRPEHRIENDKSAARFFYCAKASRSDRNEGLENPGPQFKKGSTMRDYEVASASGELRGNTHPTVKPTALMAYLCRLVTPPGGTVLDPFMGSGSTGKAAMQEGFQFIGIDMTAEYVEIAEARIAFSLKKSTMSRDGFGNQVAPSPLDERQHDMFATE